MDRVSPAHLDIRLSLETSLPSRVVGDGRYRTRTYDLMRLKQVFALGDAWADRSCTLFTPVFTSCDEDREAISQRSEHTLAGVPFPRAIAVGRPRRLVFHRDHLAPPATATRACRRGARPIR